MSPFISASAQDSLTSIRQLVITYKSSFWTCMKNTRGSVTKHVKSLLRTCKWRRSKRLLGEDLYLKLLHKPSSQLINNKYRVANSKDRFLSNTKEQLNQYSNRTTREIKQVITLLGRVNTILELIHSVITQILKPLPLPIRSSKSMKTLLPMIIVK